MAVGVPIDTLFASLNEDADLAAILRQSTSQTIVRDAPPPQT